MNGASDRQQKREAAERNRVARVHAVRIARPNPARVNGGDKVRIVLSGTNLRVIWGALFLAVIVAVAASMVTPVLGWVFVPVFLAAWIGGAINRAEGLS